MLRRTLQSIRSIRSYVQLPVVAKAEHLKDHFGLPIEDPGTKRAIEEGVAGLCRAQDKSVSQDGGVARHFSLITGCGASYQETTGYIGPTMLGYSKLHEDKTIRQRARRMLNWLVSIQFADGSFQGDTIGTKKTVVPDVFNKGQVL